MLLPFKIKLKKDRNKNAFVVHLCSISEVVKPNSKMTLLYSKIVAMWHVQVKSPTHYFGSILIHTNLRGTQLYCLLLYSNILQGLFKIGRAVPQLHKNCEIFYRSNSRWLAYFHYQLFFIILILISSRVGLLEMGLFGQQIMKIYPNKVFYFDIKI